MSEQGVPTHVLLERLKSPDSNVWNSALEMLVYRYGGPFLRYGIGQSLPDDVAGSATNDTCLKLYHARDRYKKLPCMCKQECNCAERAAHKYVWEIHKHTVIDYQRKIALAKRLAEVVQLDVTWLAPENSSTSPDVYVESRFTQEAILRAWKRLTNADRRLILYKPGLGRRNKEQQQAIQQAQAEARVRFQRAFTAELAI